MLDIIEIIYTTLEADELIRRIKNHQKKYKNFKISVWPDIEEDTPCIIIYKEKIKE